jgi:hypothetical protein
MYIFVYVIYVKEVIIMGAAWRELGRTIGGWFR